MPSLVQYDEARTMFKKWYPCQSLSYTGFRLMHERHAFHFYEVVEDAKYVGLLHVYELEVVDYLLTLSPIERTIVRERDRVINETINL